MSDTDDITERQAVVRDAIAALRMIVNDSTGWANPDEKIRASAQLREWYQALPHSDAYWGPSRESSS